MIRTNAKIQKALQYGEQLATDKGQRWTSTRASVFATVLEQDKPATAYQILEKLSEQTGKDVKPASVYRSLDALCALGLVVKIESLNAFIACTHPEDHHQHVFMVCKECGTADELADHAVSKRLTQDAQQHGFKIERQILELHGSCRGCTA